ncbi:protein dalmatian [Drosophila innubila]|uniref:protein dalmatian n=1 Tax=Drosophila innubila TaxID=198719 RepID=UPI00148BF87B|nr:protein dalmatian [Drosophila innubila]
MVKEIQRRLRMLPRTSKIKSSGNTNTFRIRKCVVKIKRVKLQLNNTASKKTATPYSARRCRVLINDINKTPLNSQSSRAIPNTVTNHICDESAFEPDRNSTMYLSTKPTAASTTPCKVRVRRIGTVQPAMKQSAGKTDVQIPVDKQNATSKPEHRFFHRDQPPTRTRSSVTRNVYDFLSESQIDDNALNQRKDPAADIIKQMIEEGRACAITRKMGKNCKRRIRKKVRPVGRRKQLSLKNKTETDQAELPPYIDRPLSPIYDPEIDSDDDNNGNHAEEAVVIEVPVQVHGTPAPQQNMSPNPHRTLLEGNYSPLARSLLQNQTKAQNPQYSIERRRELLNVARKYYSTPLNRKSTTATDNSTTALSTTHQSNNRSPVVLSPSGGSSPWRVPDEVSMPNTFVFGFNTSQLPSYSSDHMRRSHVYVPDDPPPVTEPVQNYNESISPATDDQSIANDSNGENVPPPTEGFGSPANHCFEKTVTSIPVSGQENENEENFVQLPNPRRTLQQRTPLKDINILDVVILPSWKNKLQLPKTPRKENSARNHVHFEDSLENIVHQSPQPQVSSHIGRKQQSPRNLFGFEEFLTEDEQENRRSVSVNQDITLYEKLQRLKGLRPTERELPHVSKAAMRYDFDDLNARTPKQRNIKEMLCSTMVATPPPALNVNESTDLFKDMDPEVTFDEKKPRRTYVRERPKRKRKRVHVLFVESDSSGSEDNEQDSNDKSADSPGKAVPVKKRIRRDVEHETKIKQFITSFNHECEEVDKYSLIVE